MIKKNNRGVLHRLKGIRTIVYVDGFNFYYGALKNSPYCKWINPVKLCEQILDKNHKYMGLKYFSAVVSDTPNDPLKSRRQQIYFRALKTIPNTKIILGHFVRHKVWMDLVNPIINEIETTRVKVIRYEEKGSDVNIATEILADAYEDRYDVAVLISNDSDLTAPLAYVKRKLKKKVLVLNPHKKSSIQLSRVATFSKNILENHLKMALFPKILKDHIGEFTKPSSW